MISAQILPFLLRQVSRFLQFMANRGRSMAEIAEIIDMLQRRKGVVNQVVMNASGRIAEISGTFTYIREYTHKK